MKEVLLVIVSFVAIYALALVLYYTGHQSIGEAIAILDCIGLAIWGFGFAVEHQDPIQG